MVYFSPIIKEGNACMLGRFSRVRLCATLWTAAHQAPLSTGFSRQEYWTGLPFPSPKEANAATAKSLQSCPTLCNPIDGSPPGSAISGILQARTLKWVPFPSSMHESEKWKWIRSVMSDSSRLHELQPTRLFCPWDFPGKSTGVGCHCLLWKKAMVFHKIVIILLSQKHGRDF